MSYTSSTISSSPSYYAVTRDHSHYRLLANRLVQVRRRLQQTVHHVLVIRVEQWLDVLVVSPCSHLHLTYRDDRFDGCRLALRFGAASGHKCVIIVVGGQQGVELTSEMSELVVRLLPMLHVKIYFTTGRQHVPLSLRTSPIMKGR